MLRNKRKKILDNYDLYILFLIPLIYFIVFKYIPMYGVLIAFKKYNPAVGILHSEWVGLKHFYRFLNSYDFMRIIKNTLGLSLYQLIISFPMPIFLAIGINEIKSNKFKKILQTITYAPHFISTVVLVGIMLLFLSPSTGVINIVITALGGEAINFMAEPEYFKSIYVFSDVWQNTGWGAVIYIAALAGINPSLYEAAFIDGCSRFQKIIRIDIPLLMPTAIILLILKSGKIMNLGFEKVLLMQNDLNISSSEIIQTYVYNAGIVGGQFSYTAAVGLFNNIINLILLLTVNKIAQKTSEESLW